ncbi:MAG: helix-turn-helix domain-containing protein [Alphaproteobacteria bacterium]
MIAAAIGDVQNERSVDVQINRLRKKIEINPSKPIHIQTVRNAGYILYTNAP